MVASDIPKRIIALSTSAGASYYYLRRDRSNEDYTTVYGYDLNKRAF
jgi:hypothetical protein